jgi:hypothetical protein
MGSASTDLPDGCGQGTLSSLARKNIVLFRNSDLPYLARHPASIAEGRIAIVTTREAGSGGRGGAD